MSIKKILDGCGPAPSGGRRGIHLNKLFWWIFLGTRKICVISTLTLMGVEIRQTPRAPREVYQKYCLMDVAPAPACRERSIRTSVEEILQKMFSLISHRPLGRSSKKWLMGAAPAPPGGRRETLLKKVFRRISPGTRRICRISTHALVWVEMRQALRPSPEIHKKNLLMDVAPAPAGGDRSIDFLLHISPQGPV